MTRPVATAPTASELIDAERSRPIPPGRVGEAIWAGLKTRVEAEGLQQEVLLDSRRVPQPVARSRVRPSASRWRLLPKAAAALIAVHARTALSMLFGGVLVVTGGVWASRSGVWRRPPPPVAQGSPARLLPLERSPAAFEEAGVATKAAPTPDVHPVPDLKPTVRKQRVARRSVVRVAPPDSIARGLDMEARENELLEQARASLGKGQSAEALASLAQLRAITPGDLAEERDALTVIALTRSGDLPEARRQMASFEKRHPESLYLRRLRVELHAGE
jgi:hypothetical protein